MASDTTPQFLLTLLVVSVVIGIGLIVKIQSLQTQNVLLTTENGQLTRFVNGSTDARQAQDSQPR